MYSYEERVRAVELLVKYDLCYADTVNELGYPSPRELRRWYELYQRGEDLHPHQKGRKGYSLEQKQAAVDYYLEHGRSISRTCRKLGYPSRMVLDRWIRELAPDQKKHCRSSRPPIKYAQEYKERAVVALCSRDKSAQEVAEEFGVRRETLYAWRRQLLNEGDSPAVTRKKNETPSPTPVSDNPEELRSEVIRLRQETSDLQKQTEDLQKEAENLQKQVYRLQLERDVLEKAAEVIKKDQGVSLNTLTNREKAIVIDALKDRYPVKDLLSVFHMAKSSYYYQESVLKAPDKYADLREKVREDFSASGCCYGYRRIHRGLRNDGTTVSEKVVRRIMQEEKLVVVGRKHHKYSSYKGEISPAVPNVIDRDFHADNPNEKWLTDITEFHIPAGKVYLSPMIDCFDGLPVSWTIGTSPDAELVNTMLDAAIQTLNEDEHPIVHSDRGCHYRWPGWIERMEAAGLTRSMSKKGCSPDNSACEGFFGRLKNEMFYGRDWQGVSIEDFIELLDRYIHWYAEERIKLSLGGLSPMNYRRSLGLAA